MNTLLLTWLALCLFFLTALGADQGLVGYGLDPIHGYCTYGCYTPIAFLALSCTTTDPATKAMSTTRLCRANNTPFLETLALCLHTECARDLTPAQLEHYWEFNVFNVFGILDPPDGTPNPPIKWTYQSALASVLSHPPKSELDPTSFVLNQTVIIPHLAWLKQYNSGYGIQREQIVGATYGIVILVVGFATPVILTWAGYLPFASRLSSYFRLPTRLLYPSTVGTYIVRPLPHFLGNPPTRGQALFLVTFFIINLILSTVNYQSMQPHALRPQLSFELTAMVVYRSGILAFALIPLMLLFSSRNNILLWWTNWPHNTYILLHKWIARLFFLYSLVHTLVALPWFYGTDSKREYWIWGAVAIVAMALILGMSVLYVRKQAYELFLASHIVLSVITLVGCWYHVTLWVGIGTWGYETWLYAACAVWFFDRLARFGRVLKNGLRRAKVVQLDGEGGEYVRVDIEGIRWGTGNPGTHVYVYWPFLTALSSSRGEWWRQPWENHPFSLVPSVLLAGRNEGHGPLHDKTTPESVKSSGSSEEHAQHEGAQVDLEKNGHVRPMITTSPAASERSHDHVRITPSTASGISLFIKKGSGVTKHLRANSNLLTLLDGPYTSTPTADIRKCDRLLLIGGGIGITSLLPWIANHENIKVAWSLRESARCLVSEVEGVLCRVQERDVRVGSRLDFDHLLAQEIEAGWTKVGVIVSGPDGMCDDVRAAVVAAGRKGGNTEFELEVDAYAW
ncbi:putative ferric reductase transmembrane component [Naviculisporaceae sp. PSN 640]